MYIDSVSSEQLAVSSNGKNLPLASFFDLKAAQTENGDYGQKKCEYLHIKKDFIITIKSLIVIFRMFSKS